MINRANPSQSDETAKPSVAAAARRGRGSVSNTTGRFERERRISEDDGWRSAADEEDAPPLKTDVTVEAARRIITRNTSPDIPFDRSINPYRGCEHGCAYCFARPTHAYLGLSPGLDFETKLFLKPDAPALLRAELAKPGYRPAPIAIGTNTDPYQPIERSHQVMRGILEVLAETRHPVTIVTKGALIARDADILGGMAADGLARAALSVTTLDRGLSRAMEPRASIPAKRLEAIERLSAAGVPVGVMIAPVIPGLTDHELEAILQAAKDAGAVWAEYIAIRLTQEVATLFREWLAEARPNYAKRVIKLVRDMHGGRDYDPEWGKRMRGEGPIADILSRRFKAARRRLGLEPKPDTALRVDLFRRPPPNANQLAFDL